MLGREVISIKNKTIFLDRDGTINIDRDYVYKISDFEFIPNAPNALKLLQDAGYLLIIITNQSGIARGYYTEDDYNVLNDWMLKTLKEKYNVHITASYFCPHHPSGAVEKYRIDCNCRKPQIGLFEQAIKDFDIDVDHSFAVGDKLRDLAICERQTEEQLLNFSDIHSIDKDQSGYQNEYQDGEGCKGFLVGHKESEEVIRSVKAGERKNIKYCNDLYEAAKIRTCLHN